MSAISRRALVALVHRLRGERDALRQALARADEVIQRQGALIDRHEKFGARLLAQLERLDGRLDALNVAHFWREHDPGARLQ